MPEYARVDQVTVGTMLTADGGFTCIKNGAVLTVQADDKGFLFVPCSHKGHWLSGQLDDGDQYIGFTLA